MTERERALLDTDRLLKAEEGQPQTKTVETQRVCASHRRLAARPRRRVQHDRPYPAADVEELVLRGELAGAEHLIHGRLEDGPIPLLFRMLFGGI